MAKAKSATDAIRGLIQGVGAGASMDLGRIAGSPQFGKLPPQLQLAVLRGDWETILKAGKAGAGLDPRIQRRMDMMQYKPNFTMVPDELRRDRTMLSVPEGPPETIPDEYLESATLAQMLDQDGPMQRRTGGALSVVDPGFRGYAGQYGLGPTGMIPYGQPATPADYTGLAALAAAAAGGIAGMSAVQSGDDGGESEDQMMGAELRRAAETPPLGDMDGTGATTADLAAETTPPPVIEAIPTEEEIRDAKILQELEQVLGPEDFRALQYYMQGMPLRDAVFKLMDATPMGTP